MNAGEVRFSAPVTLEQIFVEPNLRTEYVPPDLSPHLVKQLARSGYTRDDPNLLPSHNREGPTKPATSRSALECLAAEATARGVLVGLPGSGKSSLCRYLMLSLASCRVLEYRERDLEGYLPVLIELRQFAAVLDEERSKDFWTYLKEWDSTEYSGLSVDRLQAHVAAGGKTLFIFDGLDEVFDAHLREQSARKITGFAAHYPAIRVLVATRPAAYQPGLFLAAGFAQLSVEEFDRYLIKKFVRQWTTLRHSTDEAEAELSRQQLIDRILSNDAVAELAATPLLLTLIVMLAERGKTPDNRLGVYREAASVLLERWDFHKNLVSTIPNAPFVDEEDKLALLRTLAFRMQSVEGGKAGNFIHREDLLRLAAGYFDDRYRIGPASAKQIALVITDQFERRNHILVRQGSGVYGFVHRTIMDYFCAEQILRSFSKEEDAADALYQGYFRRLYKNHLWSQVLRNSCAMLDEDRAASLILRVLRAYGNDVEPWGMPLTLLLKCFHDLQHSEEYPELSSELLERTFSYILEDVEAGRINVTNMARAIGKRWPGREALVYHLKNVLARSGRLTIGIPWLVADVGEGLDSIRSILLEFADSGDPVNVQMALTALSMSWKDADVERRLEALLYGEHGWRDWVRSLLEQYFRWSFAEH
jgi:predicted NACHT family NTPase